MTESPATRTNETVALAEVIRDAALAVPGVLGISPGVGYIEATYGRNQAVLGVGVDCDEEHIAVNLHVIVAEESIPLLASRIRAAVRARVHAEVNIMPQPINLWIDDMCIAETSAGGNDRP